MSDNPPICPQCAKSDNIEPLKGRGRFTWKKWGRKLRAPFLSQLDGWHCTKCNNYFKEN